MAMPVYIFKSFFDVYTMTSLLTLSKLYSMITDNISSTPKPQSKSTRNSRNIRIVKEAENGLIISNGKQDLIFKKYIVEDARICKQLQKRFHFKHESLIQLKSIEYGKQQNQSDHNSQALCCGILFEKYTKTMEQSIKENISFSHQEVIQTFTTIKNAIDFMVHQNYDPGQLKYCSVVCTQDYQIKFIDSILHGSVLKIRQCQNFTTKVYSDLAQLMFDLLFPKEVQVKSWTRRYQIAKQELDSSHFHLFQEIYKKFCSEPECKSKKIRKPKSKNVNKKNTCKRDLDSPKKIIHEAMSNCQSGKQNVIIQ